ncbi:nucleotide-binding protein [Agromyces rhizosphaerae]|uniref:Nucleotide-binding protein n=1 Tax=Agromyces rhizosphaerae TaxID=88374 RepID=A0A9W6CYX5_9MICO|nr:RNase adapter RapZ [Agromyces rhizosphaerae]GLI28840.1 nucleotide-binding protein [Agromyces rhizosphaerae]
MSDERVRQEMLIVTGMSGAGRSTVANSLEDLGWYVVDNLPPQMLRPLVELVERAGATLPRIAAVVDIRGGDFFSELQEIVMALRTGLNLRVIFLDATDAALVRRFESVRRPHPLQGDGTILDGITAERSRVAELKASSDVIIDTSELNVHQLASTIRDAFAAADAAELSVTVMSFGFKYGLPPDADLVADARFLPNPFWNPDLRALTGESDAVARYVLEQEGAGEFLDGYARVLGTVFDGYQRENKRHATVAIGCTGGKHRSVAIAEAMATRLRGVPGLAVSIRHRDLGRE